MLYLSLGSFFNLAPIESHREIERQDGTIPDATVCGVPGTAFVPSSRMAVRARLYPHQQLEDVTRERLLQRRGHALPRLTVANNASVSSGATAASNDAVHGSQTSSQEQEGATNAGDVDLRTADIQSTSQHDDS